jgi:CRISPR/Cas system-associated exonuclease Cas4 (RecB family)
MTLSDMIYRAVEEEYARKQQERYHKLNSKMITSTEVATICERKFILSRRYPQIKPDKNGISTLMHGTMLHEYFEGLLQKYYPNMMVMESEYSAPLYGSREYKLVGHIDVLSIYNPKNHILYDFKTANPYQFMKVRNEGVEKLQHKYQLNIYKYLLERNRIRVDEMYIVYINKSRMTFNKKGGRDTVEELEMSEIPVKYEPRLVRVLNFHARDMLLKLNRGEMGLNLEDSLNKLKEYYTEVGLDARELDRENFQKWMCEYCKFKDMCKEIEERKAMGERKLQAQKPEMEMEV